MKGVGKMRAVGISQRVETVKSYGEKRDCLDQQWYPFLMGQDILPVPIPNILEEPEFFFESLQLTGLVLTGGNDLGEEIHRDRCESRLLEYCGREGLPVLGVCRGLQVVNSFFGGTLKPVNGHVAVRHPLRNRRHALPDQVNSYHAYGIDRVGSGLTTIAEDLEGGPEAVRHETLPIWGIMWHPEREKSFHELDSALVRECFPSR